MTPAEKEDDRDPAGTRRLDMLPAESKSLQRKGTDSFYTWYFIEDGETKKASPYETREADDYFTFCSLSMTVRERPVPMATDSSGFGARWTGTTISWLSQS